AQQHRRMPVMAAGMHAAFILRAIVEAIRLADRQRIHIGAQPDALRSVTLAQHADDAGAPDAVMHLAAETLELLGDERAGALFFEAELGMRVDIVPPTRQFVRKLCDARVRGHGALTRL